MIKQELLTLLALRLGGRTDPDIQSRLGLELALAQDTELEQNGRLRFWFQVSEFAEAATRTGDQRLPLPGDFLGELEEGALYVQNPDSGKFIRLIREDYDFLHDKYEGSSEGIPREYCLESHKYYRLFPTPSGSYQARMRYYEKDQSFTQVLSTAENRWMKYAADLLMAVGGKQFAAKQLQNPALAQSFQADEMLAWDRLKRAHEMREHTNRDYEMGD